MKISKKIVLIGHFGVGKSSLIRRFVEDTFTEDYKVTIGVHILKKEVSIPKSDKDITLVIWDLEGNDDITNTRPSYLIGTNGFLYVFDMTRPATYQNIEADLDYIKDRYPKTPIKVIGNKKDLVTNEFIKQNKDIFGRFVDFYTSAKSGTNVDDVFINLAEAVI
ncbi:MULTISPECIES: Rab family GTPase [unclassified Olleya]|jgi:small GTP-binding protein|uniref:Rab family GTPase n=1 Tax=unclassified Olleya TaxID=2615019 RepID=UPI0011A8052C|nr:Rab family GTPase [Olleya sp. Hel_I_94]TVZ48388.1 small GTP-binding protein [Olleya sp. Hel_I_94]|tara:strand:+ start:206336 stop:206827 length:492 start_codon:yes stop_codon:yes gene_type:complete